MSFWNSKHKFYCERCKKKRALPHPYHGGCMVCGERLIPNKELAK